MAKKAQNGVNKSAAIRELLKGNPDIKAGDAVAALGAKGIEIKPGLFYIVKGKIAGRKTRRRRVMRKAVDVAAASGGDAAVGSTKKSGALATIRKVKAVAAEVGGMRNLKELIDALSE